MTQQTWIGGTYGLFLTGTNWSPAGTPGVGDDVTIASPATFVTFQTLSGAAYNTIDSLALVAGDTLSITGGNTLILLDAGATSNLAGIVLISEGMGRNAALELAGSVVNTGTIVLDASASVDFYVADATLSGGGTIDMASQAAGILIGNGITFDNVDNLIAGAGDIIANTGGGLVNAGTIVGNGSSPLYLYGNGRITNTGLLEATGTPGLTLQGTFVNTGGTIAAVGPGAVVELRNALVVGGTLASGGGGVVTGSGFLGTLENAVNAGVLQVDSRPGVNVGLDLAGSFINRGTVEVHGSGAVAALYIDSTIVTLTGGGTINLYGRIKSEIGAGATLDNVDNFLTGGGAFAYDYPNPLKLINSGTIDASSTTGAARIDATDGLVNTGLIETTGSFDFGESLNIYGESTGVIVNTGGTLGAFGTGTGIILDQFLDIQGGTLASSGGGLIQAFGGADNAGDYTTLDGSGTHPLTIADGTTFISTGETVALTGLVTDFGTLTADLSLLLSGTLQVGTGGRVSIVGTLGGTAAGLTSLASGAVLATGSAVTANQTIQFAGTDDTIVLSTPAAFAGTLAGFASTGTIDLSGVAGATGTATGTVLSLFAGATPLGTIALAGFAGGTFASTTDGANGTDLTLQPATSNTKTWIGPAYGSFLTAADWSPAGVPIATDNVTIATPATTVSFPSTTGSRYATINSLGLVAGDTLSIGSAYTLSILDSGTSSTNAGVILLTEASYRNNRLLLAGEVVNSGTVLLTGTAGPAVYFDASSTLTGGGTVELAASDGALALAAGVTLFNVDNLIVGSGRIAGSNGGLFNAGTIDGNGTAYTLGFYAPIFITNIGLLEGTGTKGLALSGTILDTAGTIAAIGSGAGVQLATADITGGTLATAGGGLLRAYDAYGTLDNVVNTGAILVSDATRYGSVLGLADDFINRGTVIVSQTVAATSVSAIARLSIDTATVTLTGGGTIALNGGRILSGVYAGATLDNVDNLIIGSGLADYGYPDKLALINGGTIDANVAGKSLGVEPFGGLTNTGLIEATNSSSLSIESAGSVPITNTGGTIGAFGSGAVVFLNLLDLLGGTLASGAGGLVQIEPDNAAFATLDGSGALPLTIAAGSTIVDTGQTLDLLGVIDEGGTLTASGTLVVNGTVEIGTGGRVSAAGGLAGSGTLALAGGAILAAGSTVAAGQTILFGGTGDTLVLSAPASFAGTLSGFASGGTIDLSGVAGATATVTGNVATLFDGATAIGTIALADFAGGQLASATDGANGTDLTLEPPPSGAKFWIGPAVGAFLTDADWSPAGVPTAAADVTIASGADVTVPASSSAALAINSLNLAAGNTLSLGGGAFDILDGLTSNDPAGTSLNAGTIAVGAASLALAGTLVQSAALPGLVAAASGGTIALSQGAEIIGGTLAIAAGALLSSQGATLSGGGTVALQAGAVVSGSHLDNQGDVFLGAGSLGDGVLSLSNETAGTIAATTGALTVDAGAGTILNAGLIEANGFTLSLDAGSLANTGTLAALGAGLSVAADASPGGNLGGGTLSGGVWIADLATLALGGGPITDDAADIVLSGRTGNLTSGPAATPLAQSLLQIAPAGTLSLTDAGTFSTGLALLNAGTIALAGALFATTATLANQGRITGAGAITGTTVNSGTIALTGTALALGAVLGAGVLQIGTGDLDLTAAAAGTVDFTGPGLLTLGSAGNFTGTIAGFGQGDLIDLATIPAIGSIAFDPASDVLSLFTVRSASTGTGPSQSLAATVTFAGSNSAADFAFRVDASGQGTDILPCFLAGTRLLTTRGEVPVERLQAGDLAITRRGPRPIVWIGDRAIACARHRQPALVWPVRIRAGAFADRQPSRDLLLSPDHAIAWGGVLIPVRHLLNGVTMVQEPSAHAHYFHVELDAHDLVLSEGLWTESYLDTGNRSQFAAGGAPVSLHPDFARESRAEACAELCTSGPPVDAARRHLASRARLAAFEAAAVTLRIRGRTIRAARRHGDLHRFLLPAGTREIAIRCPGARIAGIVAAGRSLALDDPALAGGLGAVRLTLTRAAATLDVRILAGAGMKLIEEKKGLLF